jgi:hypothetical protein
MVTTSYRSAPELETKRPIEDWFFTGTALAMISTSLIAFLPAIVHPAERHAPLSAVGLSSVGLLALMIPLGYTTTIAMVRRGYDLSSDLQIDRDPPYATVFPLCNLVIFSALAIAALACRRRPEIHKRLMLFANIELMPAPLAHLIGHTPWLASLPPAIVMLPISMFVLAAIARDWMLSRRIHRLTWGLAILRMVSGPLEAGPLGSSAAWHHFIDSVAR